MLAGAFEALVAADLPRPRASTRRGASCSPRSARSSTPTLPMDALKAPKSRLQEHAYARSGHGPAYRVVSAAGPDHDRRFVVEVSLDGVVLGVGAGAQPPRGRDDGAAEVALEGLADELGPEAGARREPRAAARAPPRRVQVVRGADARLVRAGHLAPSSGPNGSGKSNLADALRWALGEQGRALRTRRAEDLIFAGSASRKAVGHGRRERCSSTTRTGLLRRRLRRGRARRGASTARARTSTSSTASGSACATSSTCSTTRTSPTTRSCSSARAWSTRRSRCGRRSGGRSSRRRPASASTSAGAARPRPSSPRRARTSSGCATCSPSCDPRPDASRPRPSSRRRAPRRAPSSRPRSSRSPAIGLRRGRARRRVHAAALGAARRDADEALAALREAEETATGLARALSERADAEAAPAPRARRGAPGTSRRRGSRRRALESEADAAGAGAGPASGRSAPRRRRGSRRRASCSRRRSPDVDPGAEDRARAGGAAARRRDRVTPTTLRDAGQADAERAASARAARARLAADADRAARRAVEAAGGSTEQRTLVADAEAVATAQEARAATARETAAAARPRPRRRRSARPAPPGRRSTRRRRGSRPRVTPRRGCARADAGAGGSPRRRCVEELASGPDEAVVGAVRARGGRPLVEGLEVEPGLRAAVEAALGDALAGLLLDAEGAGALRRGAVGASCSADGPAGRAAGRATGEAERLTRGGRRGRRRLARRRGLRRDPDGHAARLLARSRWVPDLATALRLRELLPPGWRLVTRDGVVLDDLGVLRPAAADLARSTGARPSRTWRRVGGPASAALAEAEARTAGGRLRVDEATRRLEAAQARLEDARRARRVADDEERAAATAATDTARERAWQAALLERARGRGACGTDGGRVPRRTSSRPSTPRPPSPVRPSRATDRRSRRAADLRALDERVATLRAERDARGARGERRAGRPRPRARAAASRRDRRRAGPGAARGARRATWQRSRAREADLAAARDRVAADLAAARTREHGRERGVRSVGRAARDERQRLLRVGGARGERARAASRRRVAEPSERGRRDGGARSQLEAAREGLLVELASIGRDGLAALLARERLRRHADDPLDGEALPGLPRGRARCRDRRLAACGRRAQPQATRRDGETAGRGRRPRAPGSPRSAAASTSSGRATRSPPTELAEVRERARRARGPAGGPRDPPSATRASSSAASTSS